MVKNLPVMRETGTQSLDWEDPLQKAIQPTPVFLHGVCLGQRSLSGEGERGGSTVYNPWLGSKESDTTEQLTKTHYYTQEGSLPHRIPIYQHVLLLCV